MILKNIVKVMLENYGYDVIDLGKDVPPELIVDTAIKEDVKLVGLSALMTTTVVSMEDTIKLLKEKKPDTLTVVGGAVMTQGNMQIVSVQIVMRKTQWKQCVLRIKYLEENKNEKNIYSINFYRFNICVIILSGFCENDDALIKSQNYLKTITLDSPDAVIAYEATGMEADYKADALLNNFKETDYVTASYGDLAKSIIAISLLGENPKDFNKTNLVEI